LRCGSHDIGGDVRQVAGHTVEPVGCR
jgi:hypothetical protein